MQNVHNLSFAEFYALREQERQAGFVPPKKKKKKNPPGKLAVPAKNVDVQVKVGIVSQADGAHAFKSRRCKTHSVTVKSNADKEGITHLGPVSRSSR